MTMQFVNDDSKWTIVQFPQRDCISWTAYGDTETLEFKGMPPVATGTSDREKVDFLLTHPVHAQRVTQGQSWNGGFDENEALLFTDFLPGPIALQFSKKVRGVRTRIEARDPVAFHAMVSAFAGNTRVNLPKEGTRDDGTWNGAPLMIGFLEDAPEKQTGIDRVEFHIRVLSSNYAGAASFAIGPLDLILD